MRRAGVSNFVGAATVVGTPADDALDWATLLGAQQSASAALQSVGLPPLDTSLDQMNGEAHQAFLALQAAATAQGLAFTVRSTRRSCAQQHGLWLIGRTPGDERTHVTNADGCVSWHVAGRAVDVTMTTGTYADIGALAKSMGWKWGGDFPGFPDVGHVEWHPGLTIEQVCPVPSACSDASVDVTLPGEPPPATVDDTPPSTAPLAFLLGSLGLLGLVFYKRGS